MKLLEMFGIRRDSRGARPVTKHAEPARRSCFRMPCLFSFEMRIVENDTVASAVCSNLSGTGMRINTKSPLERSNTLECWLPTFNKPLVAIAHIVRTEEATRGAAPSFGLRFEHASDEDEDRLFGHVLDLQRAEIRRNRIYGGRTLRPAPAMRVGEVAALRSLVRPALEGETKRALG